MADFYDPSKDQVRDFITQGEKNSESGIYHDPAKNEYPTHGLGINVQGKSREFLVAYIDALNLKPFDSVDHYIFDGTNWVIDETAGKKDLVDEVMWLSNASNTKNHPFGTENGIPSESPIRLISKENQNNKAFDEVVYDAYLNGKYNIPGVISNVGVDLWEKFEVKERLALFSLHYKSPSLIGSRLKSALVTYTEENVTDEIKLLAKLSAWYEILCGSNGGINESIRNGVQNRRFMEANAFLGNIQNKITEGSDGKNNSVFPVDAWNSKVVVAFMNSLGGYMIEYFGGMSAYKERKIEIVRNCFSQAVEAFFYQYGYNYDIDSTKYNLDTLFTDWNLKIDAQISVGTDSNGKKFPTGTISYSNVTGTDSRDVIIITAENNGMEVRAGNGNDDVYCGRYNDIVYAGKGDDYIVTNQGNDRVFTTDGADTDFNKVKLGAGSDYFRGGNGNDDVDGGSDVRTDFAESATDVNDIDLGGGQNRYTGGIGTDKVTASGYNTIFLGAGSDEYTGGDGIDIVDGGSSIGDASSDGLLDINIIHLGGGDDRYTGGIGIDKVWGGSGLNTIQLGTGANEYYGGDDIDIVEAGSIFSYDHLNDVNTILLEGGDDNYRGGNEIDKVWGGAGDDYISTSDGNDELHGGDDKDNLNGGAGEDILYGDDGDDKLYGGRDHDILVGGCGNDYMEGGTDCSDTYIYNLGDGFDRVYDFGDIGAEDTIKFGEGISYDDFIFTIEGGTSNLVMTFRNDSSQGIILEGYFAGRGYEKFRNKILEFADGSKVNLATNIPSLSKPTRQADLLIQAMNAFAPAAGAAAGLSGAVTSVSEMCDLACSSDLSKKAA